MSIELLQTLSLILFIAAGLFLAAAVILFFVLRIPRVIGDVSGATARKAIADIRQQNEESGSKAYKPSPVNSARGRITDKMTPSGRLEKQRTDQLSPDKENFWLRTEQLPTETTVLETGSETTVLGQSAETTVLMPDNTPSQSETTVLTQEQSEKAPFETTVLTEETGNQQYSVDYEIGFSGSSEIIE